MIQLDSEESRDAQRIQFVLSRIGWFCAIEEAWHLWEFYSGSMYASWLTLPEKDVQLAELLHEVITLNMKGFKDADGHHSSEVKFIY